MEQANSSDSKGKALEQLIACMFECVPGFQCTERVRTATEEIDICVLNKSTDEWLRRAGSLILVECKNWQGLCGKNELVLFEEKLRNRRGQAKWGFFVSWNGFASTYDKEALRTSQADYVIACLDRKSIAKAIETGLILPTLFGAWFEAVNF